MRAQPWVWAVARSVGSGAVTLGSLIVLERLTAATHFHIWRTFEIVGVAIGLAAALSACVAAAVGTIAGGYMGLTRRGQIIGVALGLLAFYLVASVRYGLFYSALDPLSSCPIVFGKESCAPSAWALAIWACAGIAAGLGVQRVFGGGTVKRIGVMLATLAVGAVLLESVYIPVARGEKYQWDVAGRSIHNLIEKLQRCEQRVKQKAHQ